MEISLNFAYGSFASHQLVGLAFFKSLTDKFIGNRTDLSYKNRNFPIYKYNYITHDDETIRHIHIRMLTVDHFIHLKDWCNKQNIFVGIEKRMIDSNKIWWPIIIRIKADDNNELLFLTKLQENIY